MIRIGVPLRSFEVAMFFGVALDQFLNTLNKFWGDS